MSDVVLRVDGLGHAYRPGAWVFRDYSFELCRGRVLAVLGQNGCGKTTLLKILVGALAPSAGSCSVASPPAFVPQLFDVSFDYRVVDLVVMGRARRVGLFSQPSGSDVAAAHAALERCGVRALAERPFHELSGGQRQLVILARALASEAAVLILDEPTSALDLKHQADAMGWLRRLSRESGLTIVFTTHQPGHALAIADDVLLMKERSPSVFGPASEVLSEANLRALYGLDVRRVRIEHDGRMVEAVLPILTPRA